MSNELTFKRPGRIEIKVSLSKGGKLYLHIQQATGRRFSTRFHHIADALAIHPSHCELVENDGRWTLNIGETAFHFEPKEAQQLQETFGLQVRHIPAKAARTAS